MVMIMYVYICSVVSQCTDTQRTPESKQHSTKVITQSHRWVMGVVYMVRLGPTSTFSHF